ncbi:MAG: choice-of-anchor J domain-containing protein, partial [Bacteroidales bacterium]|nr:choice-of-anchor J domain-containing protein [Bacteroidales bacterium]
MYHAVLPGDAHTGAGCIFSESYCNALGALFPDDYVVSPAKVAIGATSVLKFYACTKDDGYPSEHFGVAVSTAGNTSASDFTTIAEWTMTGKGEAKTTRGRGEQGTWYQYSVDLSEYAGQEIWVALRHFNTTDMFILMVDDMELVNEGKADRALVNYQIMLDGVLEAELTVPYYQHENLVDSVEYTTTVVATYSMGESEEMSYTWTKAPNAIFAGVKNLVASLEGEEIELSWTLPAVEEDDDDDNQGGDADLSFSFDQDLEGWTNIDADGDGHVWYHSSESELYHAVLPGDAHTGAGYAGSESYCNYYGPLYPDNYFVTPAKYAVENGAKISFYACTKDDGYPAEHFGVAVSTTGNTSAADFTTIVEWTMTGKSSKANPVRGRGEQGNWYQYTADLSAYAGQEIYIALRHFNCTDMFILMVDDVEISLGSKSRDSKEGTWAYYDDGNYNDGIGGPASFSWGIKLRGSDIASLGALTKVAIYDRLTTAGTFDICLG